MFSKTATALLALSAVGVLAADIDSYSYNSWDFLLFVSRWPQSVDTNPVPSNVTDFTIHGMWPENNNTQWPQDCSDESLNETVTNDILFSSLSVNWPNLDSTGTDDGFWAHEWSRHGTCACNGQSPVLQNQEQFFSGALTVLKHLNIMRAFTKAGMSPGNWYSLDDYHNAIETVFGFPSMIVCNTHNDNQTLMRVVFCLDAYLRPYECNAAVTESIDGKDCNDPSNIYWPPLGQ